MTNLEKLLQGTGVKPAKTETEKALDKLFSPGFTDKSPEDQTKQVLDDLFKTFGRIFSPDANPNIDFLQKPLKSDENDEEQV